MKKFFVAEGTMLTRSTDNHDYKYAIIGRGPSVNVAAGGFRADKYNAENEAARLNRIQASVATRSGKPQAWIWEVVPAREISAAHFKELKEVAVNG